uniref:Meiosis-expressed protein n=1 Tax=Callinectes arcuatus TaxID=257891 RepID=A0A7T1L7A1_CALAT|nr:meiosis-expressed protein [Callinectes arcuatus]
MVDLSVSGSAVAASSSVSAPPSKAAEKENHGTPSASATPGGGYKHSKKNAVVSRVDEWNDEAEDIYRLQLAGWDNLKEYEGVYGEAARWDKESCPSQWISKLQLKSNGYYVYFRKHRECEEKDLKRIKRISSPVKREQECGAGA